MTMSFKVLTVFTILLCLLSVSAGLAVAQDDPFENAVTALNAKSFTQKQKAIDDLLAIKDPRAIPILRTMLAGDLYAQKSDDRIITRTKADKGYEHFDVITGESLGVAGSRDAKKISINNSLRNVLLTAIAKLGLSGDDPDVRLSAAKQMLKDVSPESVKLLKDALQVEVNDKVKQALNLAIAVIDVNSQETATRLDSIEVLSQSMESEVRVILNDVLKKDDQGEFVETDIQVINAARDALDRIEFKLGIYNQLKNLFFGLSLGSVLLLAAVGLAITFGVMGVINMAHGEMIMLGAYTTYVMQQLMPNALGTSLILSIPAAFIVAGLVGIAIERGVIRFMYGRPLETLLATFGISLILQQLVRSIFSPLNRSVANPDWMSGSVEINPALFLTYNRLYIILFSLLVLAALMLLLKKTRFGLHMRAVTQNRRMARAMGIRSGWIDAMTFGLGSGIAGIAGVALSQLTNVGPNMGQAYIIDSFMVVVFGGVGNLLGTFFGAMTLGIANKFLEPAAGTVLAKILILIFIIIFIQRRPRGMFALKGRAADL